ncbi:sodium:proton antiporter [Jannaschia sp. EhC01]|nr:sodium:proton antiporter [Jannaschia sp. EhC01]
MDPAPLMITVGVLFLAALALDTIGRIVHVPRVTLLILLGAALGPPGLDVLPDILTNGDESFAAMALTMVAFLLGGSLERSALAAHGREILAISLSVVAVSALLVGATLILIGTPVVVALALAGISAATAPAATRDVVRQSGRKGRFATNLLGIVAIDDAWGLLAFSLLLTLAGFAAGGEGGADAIRHGLWEAGGGLLLGAAIGLPAAYLTGRLKRGEPSLLEALGIVLICAGSALYLEVSYLLAGMAAGAIVVNLAKHHRYPFHEIERIEWPFVLLFFIMAGALLDFDLLAGFGWIGVVYVVARLLARLIGGWLGARLSGLDAREGLLTGLAMAPQAGVAIGMALVTADRFPEHSAQIIAITIATTIVFELIGPLLTQYALARGSDEPS